LDRKIVVWFTAPDVWYKTCDENQAKPQFHCADDAHHGELFLWLKFYSIYCARLRESATAIWLDGVSDPDFLNEY
jgi:hypothetical protein